MKYKHYVAMILIVLLSGCLSPVKLKPQSTYVITKMPSHIAKKKVRRGSIMVLMPDTSAAYNTTQMAYTLMPYQIAYFSENRWAETPAQMLQPLIVQTLQNTGRFRAVITPPFLGNYDYLLHTQILTLQQDFTRRPAVLELTVRAQLVRGVLNRIIATKEFIIVEPIYQPTPYGGVIATNRASARLLSQLASFTLKSI